VNDRQSKQKKPKARKVRTIPERKPRGDSYARWLLKQRGTIRKDLDLET